MKSIITKYQEFIEGMDKEQVYENTCEFFTTLSREECTEIMGYLYSHV